MSSQRQPPFLTTQQMREVDRVMIQDYEISLLQMMENAGRCLADLARSRFFGGDPRGQRVLVGPQDIGNLRHFPVSQAMCSSGPRDVRLQRDTGAPWPLLRSQLAAEDR